MLNVYPSINAIQNSCAAYSGSLKT